MIGPAPRRWFWSHDIQPDQIEALSMPGMRLQRLANYRRGADAQRRFAALYHDDNGSTAPPRTWLIDADPAAAVEFSTTAVALSVDVTPDGGRVGVTLVLDAQPNPDRALHTGLDAAGVAALIDGDTAVVDLATYRRDGTRRFAVLVEPAPGRGSLFFPALSCDDVRPVLGACAAVPVRARAYHSPVGWQLAVVGTPTTAITWSVHVDVAADDVSHQLEVHRAYPLDLDAIGHGLGVRYALVTAR